MEKDHHVAIQASQYKNVALKVQIDIYLDQLLRAKNPGKDNAVMIIKKHHSCRIWVLWVYLLYLKDTETVY